MAIQVEIYREVMEEFDREGVPPEIKHAVLKIACQDLKTKLSDQLGTVYCVAPVRLRKYVVTHHASDMSFLYNFVFLVNDVKKIRRIVDCNIRKTTWESSGS